MKKIVVKGIYPDALSDYPTTLLNEGFLLYLKAFHDNIERSCNVNFDSEHRTFEICVDCASEETSTYSAQELFDFIEKMYAIFDAKISVICIHRGQEIDDSHLSEGQRQWIKIIGLLCAAKNDSNLIMLDEPDAHMNPRWKYELASVIMEISGVSNNRKILLVTHDPLVINGVDKRNIHILERKQDYIYVKNPDEDTVGLGIDGLLQSQYYGLISSYDKQTTEKFRRRMELYAKYIQGEYTKDERNELRTLTREIGRLPLAQNSIDFLYYDFMKEYIRTPYYHKEYLSFDECEERRKAIITLIQDLYEGEE